MYLITAPWWLRKLYPGGLIWDLPTTEKAVYLTFDDGPHPQITPFVLDCLKANQALATFFCIGKNVQQHPGIFQQIIAGGHRVGNHTHNHINGFRTATGDYISDVVKAAAHIDSTLFRPPYGKITRGEANALKTQYKLVMWSVLSGDFDTSLNKEKCLANVIKHVKPGSVIVFHDSEKAFPRLSYALPRVLEHLNLNEYKMKVITGL